MIFGVLSLVRFGCFLGWFVCFCFQLRYCGFSGCFRVFWCYLCFKLGIGGHGVSLGVFGDFVCFRVFRLLSGIWVFWVVSAVCFACVLFGVLSLYVWVGFPACLGFGVCFGGFGAAYVFSLFNDCLLVFVIKVYKLLLWVILV